jgi:hypothetical protein
MDFFFGTPEPYKPPTTNTPLLKTGSKNYSRVNQDTPSITPTDSVSNTPQTKRYTRHETNLNLETATHPQVPSKGNDSIVDFDQDSPNSEVYLDVDSFIEPNQIRRHSPREGINVSSDEEDEQTKPSDHPEYNKQHKMLSGLQDQNKRATLGVQELSSSGHRRASSESVPLVGQNGLYPSYPQSSGSSLSPGIENAFDRQRIESQIPQEEHAEIVSVTEDGDNVIIEFSECGGCLPCFEEVGSCIPTMQDLKNACSFVLNNKAETTWGKSLVSFANIRMRCFLAVDTWTTLRQAVARLLGLLALKYPILGWALGATPIVYIIASFGIGYCYDKWNDKVSDEAIDKFINDIELSIKNALKPDISQDNPIDNENDYGLNAFTQKLVDTIKDARSNDDSRIEALKQTLFPDSTNNTIVDIGDDLEVDLAGDYEMLPPQTELDDLINTLKIKAGLDDETCLKIKNDIKIALDKLKEDLELKTWTTQCTTLIRAVSTIIIAVLGGVAAYYSILPKIGATLFAFAFTYCNGRDITQTLFPLVDDLKKFTAWGATKSGFKYVANQAVAGFLSSWWAGPSGQAGVLLSFLASFKYDVLRGNINGWFEAIDTWCIYDDQCTEQMIDMKVGLTMDTSDFWTRYLNTITGIANMRKCAFNEVVMFESLFFNFVEVDENIADLGKKAIVSATTGGYLGLVSYLRLIGMMRVNWPHGGFTQSINNMLR